MSIAVINPAPKRRASDYIRHLPARNLHHGIRLAESKGLTLNTFVSLNFSLTDCPAPETDTSFQKLRTIFTKWVTRPPKDNNSPKAPPTFVWVIENQCECLNAHWLVHVPAGRLCEFRAKLSTWLERAAGQVFSDKAIDIRPAQHPTRIGKYMLKGMYPSLARDFAIRPEYQGWVTGRRIGHSKNIGPVQLARMRSLGKHPPASRWIHGKYKRAMP